MEHSLSPRLFRHLFDELGVAATYRALRTRPEELAERVESVRSGNLGGISVTIPHKEAIIPHLDELAPIAALTGAVNCVAPLGRRRVIGHNTDGRGFELALEQAGVKLSGARVLILGAGGAARAAAFSTVKAGALSILLANRTPARAERLAQDLIASGLARGAAGQGANRFPGHSVSSFGPGGQPTRHTAAETVDTSPSGCVVSVFPLSTSALGDESVDIVVNATSVGLDSSGDPLPEGIPLDATRAAMDIVYRPLQTRLLARARACGAAAIDGLWMLVYQALEQFRIWTSRSVPADFAARLHTLLCEEAR